MFLVGNARFVTQSEDGYIPASLSNFEKQETGLGRTIIFVSIHRGFYSSEHPLPILADAPKPSSKHAIRALHAMGIEVNMMMGDGMATALAVAKQVGIRPEGAAMVTELIEKDSGGVAMVCSFFYMNCLRLEADLMTRWETGATTRRAWWQPQLASRYLLEHPSQLKRLTLCSCGPIFWT